MMPNIERARILVVDDNEAARYALVRVLRNSAHEVIEGATGRAALDISRKAKPDLLVLDVRLPDILGFEVTEELRSDPCTRAMPILQISASLTAADARAQGLRRGADAYLTQPIETEVLLATVEALLRMRAAEQMARVERERALASEQRYRFLADMVPQLIWSADVQGRPDYFNQRWCDFSGLDHEALFKSDWTLALHPEDRDVFRQAWQRALDTGTPLEIECRRWSPPLNAFRWLLVRAMPMRDDAGKVARWFGTSTDIQAHKQSEAECARLADHLRVESQRKNEFLAVLSHELRNPLAPIRNSLYIIERADRASEQFRRAIAVIDRQSLQLSRLVDDLLDVTRITRGKIRLQPERVDLNVLVRRTTDDYGSSFKRAGIDFRVDIPKEPMHVQGDPARLAQVIGNILQNAAKFTPAGGSVVVTLASGPGAIAELRVRDSGAGIGAEALEHLFEPFMQAEQTLDRSKGGLGLGLALAHGIVEMHGGSIVATSEGPGKGSEFIVKLARERDDSPTLAAAAPEQPQGAPLRILIIEDLQDAAQSMQESLCLIGHDAVIAYDGPSGIALARTFAPDVVLCDIGLPAMDGYEVARQLRKEPALQSAFLVALSGYTSPEAIDRCKRAGFDRHLAKPAGLDSLEALLVEAARRPRARLASP